MTKKSAISPADNRSTSRERIVPKRRVLRSGGQNSPNKRLFIGGVPYKFREGQLLTLFVQYGKVIDIRIIYNKWGRSRGLAYIEFENLEDALVAQKNLHNYQLDPDRHLIVDFAKPDPYLTPEGAARHIAAMAEKKRKRPTTNFVIPKPTSVAGEEKPVFHPKSFYEHQRFTVFKSRNFHAKVGAKFSSRTRKSN